MTYSGLPLVYWAIESNLDSDALRLLQDAGVDFTLRCEVTPQEKEEQDSQVKGMNVLHAVCARADSDILSWLLNVCLTEEDALKLLNQKANKESETPLMIASKLGSFECVRQILEYLNNVGKMTSESINAQNADGNTCLHLAAANKPLITYF